MKVVISGKMDKRLLQNIVYKNKYIKHGFINSN